MRRPTLATLALTALLIIAACGNGVSHTKGTGTPLQPGRPSSAEVAAAQACRAMATMLDTFDNDFPERIDPQADPTDLLAKIKRVSAAGPKWSVLAADLTATANAARSLSSIPKMEDRLGSSGPMFVDGAEAAIECDKIPAAREVGGLVPGLPARRLSGS